MSWNWISRINDHMHELLQALIDYTPKLIAAILIVLFGYLIAKLFRLIISKLTRGLDYLYNGFSGKHNARGRVKRSISSKVAGVGFWLTFLFFIIVAVQFLKIPGLKRTMQQIVDYLPHILLSVVILFIGYVISEPIRFQLSRYLKSKGFLFFDPISHLLKGLILFFAILISIDQLGVNIFLLDFLVLSFFTAFFLAISIAATLSLIPYLQHMISIFYIKKIFEIEQTIEFEGHRGNIKSFTQTGVILQTDTGDMIIPGKYLFDQIITRQSRDI